MNALGMFFSALASVCSNPTYLLLMCAFTIVGILMGALPGVSVNMALILCLPLTYTMNSETAMAVLLPCYIGAMSGGLISAIMLNIPGTTAAMTTTFDGHPLAEKGQGGRTIGIGILTSFIGGGVSFLLLVLLAPNLAQIAMKFGNWEYFAVGVFSLVMIVTVAGDNLVKGLLAALIGMLLATTGTNTVDGIMRYNFGLHALDGGISTAGLMCGMFALPQILKLARNVDDVKLTTFKAEKVKGYGISPKEYLSHWWCVLRSAVIGTYVGILPGIGGGSASIMSYTVAKESSRHREEYGKGSVEGLIASETANNAAVGGAMVPMLALGVPGSSSAAILLGALALHNIQCGPLAFSQHSDLIYSIFAIMFIANIFMLIFERVLMNGFIRLLTFDRRIIMVVIMVMCFIGSYSSRNNFTDVYLFVLGGLAGYLLQMVGITKSPIVLGYILGQMVEQNLMRAMSVSRNNFWAILHRPIAMGFIAAAVLALGWELYKRHVRKRKGDPDADAD